MQVDLDLSRRDTWSISSLMEAAPGLPSVCTPLLQCQHVSEEKAIKAHFKAVMLMSVNWLVSTQLSSLRSQKHQDGNFLKFLPPSPLPAVTRDRKKQRKPFSSTITESVMWSQRTLLQSQHAWRNKTDRVWITILPMWSLPAFLN